ncbi:DUF192 domain-containing protein [Patescibacteria group bacterium]|nr:DUF192 domain-containing protein [Patescibacteria group bacterium]
MKKILFILGILFIILIAIAISQNKLRNRNFSLFNPPTATIENHMFKLYVAKNPKDQEIGLSKYNSLPQDYGMLFPFEKPDYYSFWMKKMKFPIDIIFIRKNRIVTIYQNVNPPKNETESLPIFKPNNPTDMVLEINAGLSQKYNLKENDEVKYENLGN